LEPTFVPACLGQGEQSSTAGCNMAEVSIYGDVVLRFVSFSEEEAEKNQKAERVPFLPHLSPTSGKIAEKETYGIYKIDHAVGNVPDLQETLTHVSAFTGFHEFAEFTAEDVGTVDSGLNSVVLASDSEDVLLPLNEPTQGRRKSQIQTYLEQNEGAGLQHLALKSYDIFSTIRQMKEAEENFGGFELMTRPSDSYYRELPERLGDQLTVRSTMLRLLCSCYCEAGLY
jgi:4-hydroxyphenylpyruvate dioxygenase